MAAVLQHRAGKKKPEKIDAVAVAVKYAEDVLSGAIVTGKLTQKACERFQKDLQAGESRGLVFRPDKAQHVVDFFGFLRHAKGQWDTPTIRLEPWQIFILVNLFGWYRADGKRRFREAHIEVGRKNGKSTLLAGIGLYMLWADNEPGAEVYSAATTKDQAREVFDTACSMRDKSPMLANKIESSGNTIRNSLFVVKTNSKFRPLASEADTLDGKNVHCAIIDELHKHPDRKLYDVLYEATKSRRNPLVITITTAGFNRESICWTQRKIGEDILNGITSAKNGDAFFIFVACIDKDDKWDDEACWPKANPNLGVSVDLEGLREAAQKAKADPTALNSFLNKHLNAWTSQDVQWMYPDVWAACCAKGPDSDAQANRVSALAFLKDRVCFGGLDLSKNNDLSAFVLIFPPTAADLKTYVLPYFWLPEENVEKRVRSYRVEYDGWRRAGFLELTEGNTVDQDFIEHKIVALRNDFKIVDIGYDDWECKQLAIALADNGLTMVDVRQGFNLSESMKEIMALTLAGKIEHFNNPVLRWMMSNVAAETNPQGRIKPSKKRSPEKIDGVVAMVIGMSRVIAAPGVAAANPYTGRGITFI